MARYLVDPDRSTITVVPRPRLADTTGPLPASVSGEVDIDDAGAVVGTLSITLDGSPETAGRHATIDLDGTTLEVKPGRDGEQPVLHGRATRSAGTFGLAGSPLLNPSLELRWRLTLIQIGTSI